MRSRCKIIFMVRSCFDHAALDCFRGKRRTYPSNLQVNGNMNSLPPVVKICHIVSTDNKKVLQIATTE